VVRLLPFLRIAAQTTRLLLLYFLSPLFPTLFLVLFLPGLRFRLSTGRKVVFVVVVIIVITFIIIII